MRNQLNVPLCLNSLSLSMRHHIIEAQLYTTLLAQFSEQEIKSQLAHAAEAFAAEFEGARKSEASRFAKKFCAEFAENQRSDVERMLSLEKEIGFFRGKYEESRKDIEEMTDYVCSRCGQEYATPNGLHLHMRNPCSSGKKAKTARVARETRASRRGRQTSAGQQ